jgi:hypothetical protein
VDGGVAPWIIFRRRFGIAVKTAFGTERRCRQGSSCVAVAAAGMVAALMTGGAKRD